MPEKNIMIVKCTYLISFRKIYWRFIQIYVKKHQEILDYNTCNSSKINGNDRDRIKMSPIIDKIDLSFIDLTHQYSVKQKTGCLEYLSS